MRRYQAVCVQSCISPGLASLPCGAARAPGGQGNGWLERGLASSPAGTGAQQFFSFRVSAHVRQPTRSGVAPRVPYVRPWRGRSAGPAAVVWLFSPPPKQDNDCVTCVGIQGIRGVVNLYRHRAVAGSGDLAFRAASSVANGRGGCFYWVDCLPFHYICVYLQCHTRSCVQCSRLMVIGVDVFDNRLADLAQGYLALGFFLRSNDVSSHFFFPVIAITNRNIRLSYTFF